MFWALVLTVTVGGHTNEYVLDKFKTAGDCVAALQHKRPSTYRDISSVTYSCEKTRVTKR